MLNNITQMYESIKKMDSLPVNSKLTMSNKFNVLSESSLEEKCMELNFPNKIIGRGVEVKKIESIKANILNGELSYWQIYGLDNVGKSYIVNHIFQSTDDLHFFFSKFHQFNQLKPLTAIGYIIESILKKQLWCEVNDDDGNCWTNCFQKKFSIYYQELREIVPNIDLYLQKDEVNYYHESPQIVKNRINIVLLKLFTFCAEALSKPLVIYVEDLQCADVESLNIIRLLFKEKIQNLSILLSYRINDSLDFKQFLNSINTQSQKIEIPALTKAEFSTFLTQTLSKTTGDITQLLNYVHEKSKGDLYIAKEILQSLVRSSKLKYNQKDNIWSWKLIEHNLVGSHEVLDTLFKQKINSLTDQMRLNLQLCSCFGNTLKIPFIVNITDLEKDELVNTFNNAISLGLLKPISGDPYVADYEFSNDITQKFIYHSLESISRKKLHKKIAKYYIYDAINVMDDRDLFNALYHLNYSIDESNTLKEKQVHAELNLRAAMKSKNTASYTLAKQYINQSVRFGFKNRWGTHYGIAAKIAIEGYQIGVLSKDIELFKNLYNLGEKYLKQKELVKLKLAKITLDIQFGNLESALKTGVNTLKILGMNVPQKANKLTVVKEFVKTKIMLIGKTTDSIYELEAMKDEKAKLALDIIFWLHRAAYNINPELSGVLALKSLQLTLSKGTIGDSYGGLMAYGVIIGAGTNNLKSAYQFCEVGDRIAKKYNFDTGELEFGRAVYAAFRYALKDTLSHYERSKYLSYQSGDFLSATEPTINESLTYFSAGFQLAIVKEKIDENYEFCEKLGMLDFKNFQYLLSQYVSCLQGENIDLENDESIKEILRTTQYRFFNVMYDVLKLQYYCLAQNWGKCHMLIDRIKPDILYLSGLYIQTEFYFYQSLVYLKTIDNLSFTKKAKQMSTVKSIIKKMTKRAQSAPENYNHKLWTIEGLMATIKNDNSKAELLLTNAVAESKKLDFRLNTAIAYNYLSELSQLNGNIKQTNDYLVLANSQFENWGYKPKV